MILLFLSKLNYWFNFGSKCGLISQIKESFGIFLACTLACLCWNLQILCLNKNLLCLKISHPSFCFCLPYSYLSGPPFRRYTKVSITLALLKLSHITKSSNLVINLFIFYNLKASLRPSSYFSNSKLGHMIHEKVLSDLWMHFSDESYRGMNTKLHSVTYLLRLPSSLDV